MSDFFWVLLPEIRSVAHRQKRTPAQAGVPAGYGHIDFTPWERVDTFNAAEVQATEEAALVANRDDRRRDGNRTPAWPHAKSRLR